MYAMCVFSQISCSTFNVRSALIIIEAMNAPLATTAGRLADLRNVLAKHGVDAIVIPSSDPHISEYLPERWQGRQWVSGFTGSMGTLVVTRDFAGVWADSRYWAQAEKQLEG